MDGNRLGNEVSDRVLMEKKMRLERSILLLNWLQVPLKALGSLAETPRLATLEQTLLPKLFRHAPSKVIANVLNDISVCHWE